MPLFRLLLRWALLIVGAAVGLGLLLFAAAAFVVVLLFGLLTGRKPNVQFRMNRNPWAQRRRPQAPAGDVVDIQVREVREPAQPPLPLQPPRRP